MEIGKLQPIDFEIHHIPEDDKERLTFYDKLFYEAQQKNLRLKIWGIGVWMFSDVKGDYCLGCKVKKVKHFRDRVRKK